MKFIIDFEVVFTFIQRLFGFWSTADPSTPIPPIPGL